MATESITSHEFDDASLRGTIMKMWRHRNGMQAKRWEKQGFKKMTTKKPFEEFSRMSGIGPAPIKEQNAQTKIDVPKQGETKRVNVTARAVMIPISEEMQRFLSRGQISPRQVLKPTEMVNDSVHIAMETDAADIFANAFDTTNAPGPDLVSLVNDSHRLIKGGTDSNYIGPVSFDQASLEAAAVQSRKFLDDVGIPVGVGDGERILALPEDYVEEAERILMSTLQSDNANNAINVLKNKRYRIEGNPHFASSSNWFVVHPQIDGCLIMLVETEPRVDDFGDDKTGTRFFRAYVMYGVDFYEWRGIQGSDI